MGTEIHHVYSKSRGEDSCEVVSGAPSLVFFPMNPRSHYMGVGRIEKEDSEIDRRSSLNNGSRQCVVQQLKVSSSELNHFSKKTSSTSWGDLEM